MTEEQKAMFDELGVSVSGVTAAASGAMDDLDTIIYGSDGIKMDAEPLMSAADIIREKAQYDKATGSQSGRYNQTVNITVEGNLDTEAARQTTEQMKVIANEAVETSYNKGNRKGGGN